MDGEREREMQGIRYSKIKPEMSFQLKTDRYVLNLMCTDPCLFFFSAMEFSKKMKTETVILEYFIFPKDRRLLVFSLKVMTVLR